MIEKIEKSELEISADIAIVSLIKVGKEEEEMVVVVVVGQKAEGGIHCPKGFPQASPTTHL